MKKLVFVPMMLAVLPAAGFAQVQPPPPRTVTVSAHASIDRQPDRAVILLAVESQAEAARTAASQNATAMQRVLAAIRATGVPEREIRTTSYNLYPVYAPQPREPRPVDEQVAPRVVGYRAVNMVQVNVDTVTRAGAVIDAAIEAGANRVAGLSFELRDPQAARLEAIDAAVRKARAEAQTIATAAGETLGPVLTIHTDGGYMPAPAPAYRMIAQDGMAMAAPPPPPIEGGVMQIMANVTLVYELR